MWKCPTCNCPLDDETGDNLDQKLRPLLEAWEEEGTYLKNEPEYDGGYGDVLLMVVKKIRVLLS